MKNQAHLWIKEPHLSRGRMVSESVLELPGVSPKTLWFSVPEEQVAALSMTSDPFVLGTIFLVMRSGYPLLIHGEVSPSLIMNLEEFQMAWQCLVPHRYQKVDIRTETEREHPQAPGSLKLSTFSGGVDSCFTVWQHSQLNEGASRRKIQAALMVHGFDIPLEEDTQFQRAFENSKKILADTEVELIPVATNYKDLNNYWGDAHGAGLAFCLMMLQGRYSSGLIASSVTYDDLFLPWGSTPLTDGLMSNDNFSIVHDGSRFSRNEKTRQIAAWPAAMQHLRVCWEGEQRDQNCCVCAKCVRTILNFRVVDAGLPECFKRDVSDQQLLHTRNLDNDEIYDLKKIYRQARASVQNASWVKALRKAIWINQTINTRNRIWFRLQGMVQRRWYKLVDISPFFGQKKLRKPKEIT